MIRGFKYSDHVLVLDLGSVFHSKLFRWVGMRWVGNGTIIRNCLVREDVMFD